MLDLKWIRENPDNFDTYLLKRGSKPSAKELLELDSEKRSNIEKLQEAQKSRNSNSKEIGIAKANNDEQKAKELMNIVAELKQLIQEGEEKDRQLTEKINSIMAAVPNIPMDDVPQGSDEKDNIAIGYFGEKPTFSFQPKQHFEIGESLGMMDFSTAAEISGSRFVMLRHDLAKLERALANFMLDVHINENGYTEIAPPVLVKPETMYGTSQLPKFAEDSYLTNDGYWLVPTAEVPLTNTVREKIIDEEELPLRLTAWTPCFRSEAGSAGKDTRGMIRLHQFSKVELVSITTPEQSKAELERMTKCAQGILERLNLPYRTVLLCTGDMGFAARKTYDLEVWLPGQNAYREISSCSLCGDFQARRMSARYRNKASKEVGFVHSLNGSGLAIGRTMVAIIENYQLEDGSIRIPEELVLYMGGQKIIS